MDFVKIKSFLSTISKYILKNLQISAEGDYKFKYVNKGRTYISKMLRINIIISSNINFIKNKKYVIYKFNKNTLGVVLILIEKNKKIKGIY